MDDFLAASTSFPTVVFTVLLLITLVYWLFVIIGAVGIDALDVDLHHHGAVDGVADGAAHAGDGLEHADVHADAHGHVHADAPHVGEAVGSAPLLLSMLRFDPVPMTIVVTMVVLWAWLICNLSMHYLVGYDAHWSIELGLFAGALVLAFPLANLSVRPLAPQFRSTTAPNRAALVGKIVDVDTSYVDASFGVARSEDGGAGLLVQIRCDPPNPLTRGQRALVLRHDEERDIYEVTPIDDLILSEHGTRRD